MIKYPSSSEFEIELPQDYTNVQSLSLTNWSFPSNYNVFSDFNANRKMTFKFKNVYDPSEHNITTTDSDELAVVQTVQDIFDVLSQDLDQEFCDYN